MSQLAVLTLSTFKVADVFLITSLRDGMNLTSHEYVVCQEEKKAPLVISEFAGTYGSFGGAALRVNPWHTREVASAISEALTMSEDEKQSRWQELYDYILGNSAQTFVNAFLSNLDEVHQDTQKRFSIHIPHLNKQLVTEQFKASNKKRIIFLDDEGTLFQRADSEVKEGVHGASLRKCLDLLTRLCADERNVVYLVSGRKREELRIFESVPGCGLSAENGIFIRRVGETNWETMFFDSDLSWRDKVFEILEFYQEYVEYFSAMWPCH